MNGQFRNLTKKYSSLCEGAGGGGAADRSTRVIQQGHEWCFCVVKRRDRGENGKLTTQTRGSARRDF